MIRAYLAAQRGAVVALAILLVLVPVLFSTYITSAIAVPTLWIGLCAASLTFLASYGGMVSLAQTGLFGVAGLLTAVLMVEAGWDPWLAALVGVAAAAGVGLLFGALASSSTGTYFLMITLALAEISYYLFSAVPAFGLHEGINGVLPPPVLGDPVLQPTRIYYFILIVCALVYALLRYLVRTPFGLALQGVRDEPERMAALGYNVRLHRTLAFTLAAAIAGTAGVLSAWTNTRISADSISLGITIGILEAAVIGGLFRLEGAWVGALVLTILTTYGPGFTDRFQTGIGIAFLAIVLVSPGGLVGIGTALDARLRRWLASAGGAGPADAPPQAATGA
ncbi:MAG: branched-chain amino acid ABC transporter permease [Candidatus Limnocylindrales bacterium]